MKSSLQTQLMQKIDAFGGIEQLTTDMQRFRMLTKEKKWFDNMIIYFNSLYSQTVDVEGQAVEYHKASVDTIDFLTEFNATRNEDTIKFLINLITYKLDSVAGIKRIS